MKRRTFVKGCAAGAVTLVTPFGIVRAFPQSADADLAESFRNPPGSAGPYTWWHWMNGNATADGLTRDLEAMKRVGVAGFQIFEVGAGIPEGPVEYLSDEWLQLMQHAAGEAERLGLAFEMHNCPGWSSSGGPWITPELSMQRLVWTETFVSGGRALDLTLPRPFMKLGYYRDACVLAFPSLAGETSPLRDRLRGVTSSDGSPVDVSALTDGDLSGGVEIRPAGAGRPAFLQLEFAEPYEAQAVSLLSEPLDQPSGGSPFAPAGGPVSLQSSDDGVHFTGICEIPPGGRRRRGGAEIPRDSHFAPTRARYFRLTTSEGIRIAELQLTGARINDWVYKSNLNLRRGVTGASSDVEPGSQAVPAGAVIDPTTVVDITRHMDGDGRLRWQAPEGQWTILRLGHTPTGIHNNAAPSTGEGLECDKYSKEAYEFHFNKMLERLLPALGPLADKGMAGVLVDSYEVGPQNWTVAFPEEFQRRRGYDPHRYLPAMTGRVVESVDVSDRFLWDVRHTHADLIADNYYGHFAELCRRHDLISYAEPYDGGPFDQMQVGSRLDIPMGEFWIGGARPTDKRRTKLATSIAHVNARAVVGAESFTGWPKQSRWQECPYSMKAEGDLMYALGLNRYIFHRYAQQPHPDARPGMTMGQWGFHFERTNTWFEQGKAWIEYITRCQHLLQRGHFVADVAYFTGEDAPNTPVAPGEVKPELPPGYDFDHVNTEAILTRMSVKDGRWVLPDGMSYRLLVLPEGTAMTVALLRKIRDLVSQGAHVMGPRPERAPDLGGYPDNDQEVQRLAREVWGDMDGTGTTERSFGEGRVYWTQPLHPVLDELGIGPAFAYTARTGDAAINWIHRRIGDAEVFFVANLRRRMEELVGTFRVDGRQPELWDAATGEIRPASVYELVDGQVRVPLQLDPAGSVFVVFRSPASETRLHAVLRNGELIAGTEPLPTPAPTRYGDVTGSFTVGVWVKPEIGFRRPPAESKEGTETGTSYVFYPPQGDVLYGDGHVTAGLSASREGVIVYERASGLSAPVLVAEVALSGWAHLALVYRDGVPSLYVNGTFVKTGQSSGRVVHPGLGDAQQADGAVYFEGDMGEPRLFPEALGADRLRELAGTPLPSLIEPPTAEVATGAQGELLLWKNGDYSVRHHSGGTSSVRISDIRPPVELSGPWRVSFPPDLGAPDAITLPELVSLHEHSETGVKYFSGTATWSRQFSVPPDALGGGRRLYLDLGRVAVIAEVRLNGRDLGVLWKVPFRLDVTDAIRAGNNDLEVRVTNLWPNRLVGDEELPPENEYGENLAIQRLPDWYTQGRPKPPGGRVTFTTWHHYKKGDPLLEAGLIGPVRLRTAVRRSLGSQR